MKKKKVLIIMLVLISLMLIIPNKLSNAQIRYFKDISNYINGKCSNLKHISNLDNKELIIGLENELYFSNKDYFKGALYDFMAENQIEISNNNKENKATAQLLLKHCLEEF